MPRIDANGWIVMATAAAMVACLGFVESIPANEGRGYDGVVYTRWAQEGPGTLDDYEVQRVLPSLAIGGALRALRMPLTTANVLAAFRVANALLIVAGVGLWCRSADTLGLSPRGKWLGFLGLVVCHATLKHPFYYPALTDTFAFAAGCATLYFHVTDRPASVVIVSVLGAFVWPVALFAGALLVAFPRGDAAGERPGRVWVVLGAGVLGALLVSTVRGQELPTTPVRPVEALAPLSALLAAGYAAFASRPLLRSEGLWRAIRPARLARSPRFWAAILLFVGVRGAIRFAASGESSSGLRWLALNVLTTSVAQPGAFYLAHVLYFGPILLFAPFLWASLEVPRDGPGMTLLFLFGILLSLDSESRWLVHFWPFVVLYLAAALDRVPWSRVQLASLAAASLLVSKVWLPMDRDIAGIPWRVLYQSSQGPWIDHAAYLVQLAAVLALGLVLRPARAGSVS